MDLHPLFLAPGFQPLVVSHAGDASQGAKPGSLEAYELAWKKGLRCFQIDVVALANGELLSSHAITGRKRAWEQQSVSELRKSGHDITTVDEILDALPNSRWNIEIKSKFATSALTELILRRPEPPSHFLISSPFRAGILRDLRDAVSPDLALAAALIDGGLLGFGVRRPPIKTHAVQLWKPLVRSQRLLDRCKRNGVHVQVWTINKAPQMHAYLDRGVPGIISDDHDAVAEVMTDRGHWPKAEGYGADVGA